MNVHAESKLTRDPFDRALRVLITPDRELFFAGGIDLSYASSGNTVKDAQSRFLSGLALTIRAWLDQGLDLDQLVRTGPPELANEWRAQAGDSVYEIISLSPRAGESQIWCDLRQLPFASVAFKYKSEWERK